MLQKIAVSLPNNAVLPASILAVKVPNVLLSASIQGGISLMYSNLFELFVLKMKSGEAPEPCVVSGSGLEKGWKIYLCLSHQSDFLRSGSKHSLKSYALLFHFHKTFN